MPQNAQPTLLDGDALATDQIVAAFSETVASQPLPDDPAELEQVAATLLMPLEFGGLPAAVPAALLTEIERQGDSGAAGLLAAVGVIAGEPLAGQARAAVARLGEAGVESPSAAKLGTLTVREATRIDGGDAELLIAMLRRPGVRTTQLALLGIENEDAGGVLVSCLLTPPISIAKARRIIADAAAKEASSSAQPIAAPELAARARAAAQRTVDLGVALDYDSAVALPLIARAFTGDPYGLPRPEALPPSEEDDPELIVDAAEDEEGYYALMELLLEELEQHVTSVHPRSHPAWHSGHFIASCMLEWKGGYDDGRLGRWTAADLAEFLLDYFPRKVSASQETIAAVPECVVAFLGFLEARGSLSGDALQELEEACANLTEPFLESASDPVGWGLAKSLMMQMLSEGLDHEDPLAMQSWIEDFNRRPAEQRDAVVGGAMDRMLAGAGPQHGAGTGGGRSGNRASGRASRGSSKPKRDAQRKAQRTARKRNRPRR
jgi:hypothetical protein